MKNIQNYIENVWDKVLIYSSSIIFKNEVLIIILIFCLTVIAPLVKWWINKSKTEQENTQTNKVLELLSKQKNRKSFKVGNIEIEYDNKISPKENSP